MSDATPGTNLFKHDPESRRYHAGEDIFAAGEIGHELFVIQDGEVELVFDGEVVERPGTGGIFGEGALIDLSHIRSGTVRAATHVRVAVIDESRFIYLVERSPFFAVEVMRAIAHRLRPTTAKLLEA